MDTMNDTTKGEQVEYQAPAIVDYGDLVALTAANGSPRMYDLPKGSPVIADGFS
jgi:hypothetical protein